MSKIKKTNVMRLLEQQDIEYIPHEFHEIRSKKDHAPIYKTLVTYGKSGEYYVFLVPIDSELDLKKAAEAVGEKNIHMLKEKDLEPLTGYIHGGCSPIGMKKEFVTTVDQSALDHRQIAFSAGHVGYQVEMNPRDLEIMLEQVFFQDVQVDQDEEDDIWEN